MLPDALHNQFVCGFGVEILDRWMLVVSLAAIPKQRTALVQTDARPNATQPAYCLVPDFFRIRMLNCCSASSIMCEYPALRIFSRSRAFLSLLISLRPSDRVSSLKSTSGFWRYQTISTPRYSDHPSVGNLDAAEIEARNRLLFLEQLSHSFSAFVRQGSLPPFCTKLPVARSNKVAFIHF